MSLRIGDCIELVGGPLDGIKITYNGAYCILAPVPPYRPNVEWRETDPLNVPIPATRYILRGYATEPDLILRFNYYHESIRK